MVFSPSFIIFICRGHKILPVDIMFTDESFHKIIEVDHLFIDEVTRTKTQYDILSISL